jgi:AraC-like DNA-binding protein
MNTTPQRNTVIKISERSHLNITFNILSCGNCDILVRENMNIGRSDVFTVCYVNEGSGAIKVRHSSEHIEAGDFFVCFPEEDTSISNIGDKYMNITWVSFSGYLIENYLHRAGISSLHPSITDGEGYIGQKMSHLYATSLKMPNRYCKMVADMYNIFGYLLDMSSQRAFVDENMNAEFYALSAIDYVERTCGEGLTVEELAEKMQLSRKELDRVFSSVLNISPKKYIISVRIERACTALRKTSESIAEIAETVGYANQFYFAKEFKRLTGMTPSQYRNSTETVSIKEFASMTPILGNKYDVRVIGEVERTNRES